MQLTWHLALAPCTVTTRPRQQDAYRSRPEMRASDNTTPSCDQWNRTTTRQTTATKSCRRWLLDAPSRYIGASTGPPSGMQLLPTPTLWAQLRRGTERRKPHTQATKVMGRSKRTRNTVFFLILWRFEWFSLPPLGLLEMMDSTHSTWRDVQPHACIIGR